jgi:tetratricopeptide (TPR) repeat protein
MRQEEKASLADPSVLALLLDQAGRAHQAGRLEEAQHLYLRALAVDVRHAEALHGLGCEELDAGRAEVAARMLARAIAADDSRADFHVSLARALQAMGRLPEAVACCDRALALDPGCAQACFHRGNALYDLKKPEEAIASYRQAVDCDGRNAAVWSNLGQALRVVGQYEEARRSFAQAVHLQPDFALGHENLAELLFKLGELEAAAAEYRRALALEPGRVASHCGLGGVLFLQGRYGKAASSLEQALALDPKNAQARWHLALVQLVQGNFAEGLVNFEARFRALALTAEYQRPHWQGEALAGRRILLLDEQGLGDMIQYLRFVPRVVEAGGVVVARVSKHLRRLVEASWPGVRWIDANEPRLEDSPQEFDALCPLMSLPLVFGLRAETIPAETPYLRVPEEARRKAAALPWSREKLRVGLVWAGNPEHRLDRFRSIPLASLGPLFERTGVSFYSLQMGAGRAQLESSPLPLDLPILDLPIIDLPIIDLSEQIGDMADTAALLEHLDLLIGVDTSVVHLAGALGRPVWMLTPAAPDWRWMSGREDSPWYPTLRLFRQKKLGDWQPVVARIAAELRAMIAQKNGRVAAHEALCMGRRG